MENKEINLSDLYVAKYLTPAAPITESTAQTEQTEQELLEEKKKEMKKPVVGKKKADKESDDKVGGEYYTDSFTNVFGNILKTLKEDFDSDIGDDTFAADETGGEDFGGDEQTFTVSELRSMTLGDLADILAGGGFEDEGDDFGAEGADDIPLESYGFEGAGAHVGAQADYSGKAGLLPKTDLVDANGNIKKDKAKVGGKPTKGHNGEGAHKGAQDVRNGKAGKQSPSNLVKGNGDADFGKNKTGYGRAKGEDIF